LVLATGTQEPGANKSPACQLMADDNADWDGTQNDEDIARLVLV
jgi:hypothetical protein